MDNPFNIEGSKELDGSYSRMVELLWICRDSQSSLIYRLEEIDPEKMKHDEKLAFWINVHNALVMHAFLVYGIPQNNLKRISLLLKAAYNVGGHTISVNMIQNSILDADCLVQDKTKFKGGDARKAFAIDNPEPRLCFALCSGSRSDPVCVPGSGSYKRRLHPHHLQDTEITEDPSAGLCPAGFAELIEDLMPNFLRKRVENHKHGKFWKRIEWIPHNFVFRYLLSKSWPSDIMPSYISIV
ncbi:electron transporter, putative [Actinidia rufa]|uniref:Electron transporter, putative n=1 Tax=Actinidia rufa TaxID=165716 RepID=A0A7J0DU29_9ERIC|nr:electron transporter, putative [Actinidia rufa]